MGPLPYTLLRTFATFFYQIGTNWIFFVAFGELVGIVPYMMRDTEVGLERHYSVADLQARFGVHSNTVKKWLAGGFFPNAIKLPSPNGNGSWRVPQSDIDAFIARQIVETHRA